MRLIVDTEEKGLGYTIVDDDKEIGRITYDIKGDDIAFNLSLNRNIDQGIANEAISLFSHRLFRSGRRLMCQDDTYASSLLANGYVNDHGVFIKERDDDLIDECTDELGCIINQGQLKHIPYGHYDTQSRGCGWIAVYNLLKLNGRERPKQEIIEALQKKTTFKGLFGTNVFAVNRYLKKCGLKTRMTFFDTRKFREEAMRSNTVSIVYVDSKGAHYICYKRTGELFHMYNAIYGRHDHIVDLDRFNEKFILGRMAILISVDTR